VTDRDDPEPGPEPTPEPTVGHGDAPGEATADGRTEVPTPPSPATPPLGARSLGPDEQAREFFTLLLDLPRGAETAEADRPAGCVEIRILEAGVDRKGCIVREENYPKTFAGWFDHLGAIIKSLRTIDGVSAYATLNPVDPALAARVGNRLARVRNTTLDANVTAIRFLFLDIDPTRPADISSTEHELALAIARRDRILAENPDLAASAAWGLSGNGCWVLVRLPDYLNDTPHRGLIARALDILIARYNDAEVKIDEKPKNPSRIMAIPGTWKCKGEDTPQRPWRRATLDSPPGTPQPFDLASWVERNAPADEGKAGRADASKPAAAGRRAGRTAGRGPRPSDVETRASKYLAACRPAISGQGGHKQAIKVAVEVGPGFDLAPDVALRLLRTEWNPRCEPPWSERELRHKVDEAYRIEPERGWHLRNGLAVSRANGAPVATGGGGGGGVAPGASPAGPAPEVSEAEDDPHRLARIYIDQHCRHKDGLILRFWQSEWLRWDGAYRPVPDKSLRADLTSTIKEEFDQLNLEDIANADPTKPPPTARKVTRKLVGDVDQALSGYTHLGRAVQPSWLCDDPPWPADEVLPTRNALVHLPSLVENRDAIRPPTPLFFAPYTLDYDFDPSAPKPIHWLTFLGTLPVTPRSKVKLQLWPDDPESVATLQEWFGYLLTPDTRQEKILAIFGPKRSGKGTIARVLKALIGPENTAAPTLSGLTTNFGLAPLIGKPCALISDARLSGRADAAVIVERLLSISGEDAITIDRKHLPAWTGKLPTRFTLISNELPKLSDAAGALASRLIILKLTRSFYGQEDPTLTDLLLMELPSLLLWAIEGWRRLRNRGHFQQPASGLDLVEQFENLTSPHGEFARDRCVVGDGYEVMISLLYEEWKGWCQEKGRDYVGTEQEFGRNLQAAVPGLTTCQHRQQEGGKRWYYRGIKIA
jgi:putative DNA primase/helicase